MNCGYIYKIVFPNSNSKHYIGLTTTSLEQRTREHKSSAKSNDPRCLYKALRKYDMIDTFELIEIDRADTIEELREKEIRYIIDYNSHYKTGNGYNMTNGGEGTNGYIYTDEDSQKISNAQQIRFNNPEEREKSSESAKKRFKNPKEIQKISNAQQIRFKNPEEKEKLSEAQKKRFENPEEREKLSEIGKKYHDDHPEAAQEHGKRMKKYYEDHPEEREKMSQKGIKYYEEHPEAREKMSEIGINYYKNNPEAREKNSEARKKFHKEHPEAREKMSEIGINYYKNNPEIKKKILDIKGKNKPFDVFREDGTFIKTFTYQTDAREYLQKEHNITSTIKISEVLGGHRKSSAGFVFKYK